MKRILFLLIVPAAVFSLQNTLNAQSTYAQVYQIVQVHCQGSACHDGTVPTFNIDVTADSFYHEVVNLTPLNPAAAANFNKIIAPGDVQRSFLLRKISHGISDGLALSQPEGDYMPNNLPPLANYEVELVRQWILLGAPETGNVVDTALINSYYRNGGIDDTYSPHAPPSYGNGFQIYMGRVFLQPDSEIEYFYKWDPHFTTSLEANALYSMMPVNDYDFMFLLFQPGQDVNYPLGLRPASESSMQHDTYGIGTGPGLKSYILPANAAFLFADSQKFDLYLHIKNPSSDSIYSTDVYFNVATEALGSASQNMLVSNFPDTAISIPEDGQPHSFTITCTDSTQTLNWNLWKLYTRTHKYGTAFSIWLRNPDGSQGAEIYNGDYSYEGGDSVGYYRWGANATYRTWPGDSLLAVNPVSGLIGQATYINTSGPDPVTWGFPSSAEVMDVGFFYVQGTLPSALSQPVTDVQSVKLYPNPAAHNFVLEYQVDEAVNVQIDLYDMMGNKVSTLQSGVQSATGKYTKPYNTLDLNLSPGMYFIRLEVGGKSVTEKLIVTE